MSAVAVIPARYGATRFPGKPLAKETGKFLVQHVYERVSEARRISAAVVATDDDRIADAVRAFGGQVSMTRADHPSGTDRVAEVARGLPEDAIILNVQGDEPEVDPAALDQLVDRMEREPQRGMATIAAPMPAGDPADPSRVKVVVNPRGEALYFSRALIPYHRDLDGRAPASTYLLHLGVYAYRRAFLFAFAALPATPLEQAERLEQLRALEHGHSIAVEIVDRASTGIDTPEEYKQFVARYRSGMEADRVGAG